MSWGAAIIPLSNAENRMYLSQRTWKISKIIAGGASRSPPPLAVRGIILDLLDLVPWRCWRTHRQLSYGFPPRTSVSGPPRSIRDWQSQLFAVFSDHVHPSLLWSSSASLSMHIAVHCNLRIPALVHPFNVSIVSQPSMLNPSHYVLFHIQPCSNHLVSDLVSSCHSFYLP